MNLLRVVLDFETAYGKHPETGEKITLSAMTTEEYVRHPRFQVHGVGIKIDQAPARYYPVEQVARVLRLIPWERAFVICHHTHFDGAILSWLYGIQPAFWGCTLSMARARFPHESSSLANIAKLLGLPPKGEELVRFQNKWHLTPAEQEIMGGYCGNDVEITAMIFDRLAAGFPVSEMRLIDWTVRKFTEPEIETDQAILVAAYKAERRRKRALLKQCVADQDTLASGDKFATLLLSLGVDPPKKISPAKLKDGRVKKEEVGTAPEGLLPVLSAAERKVYPWSYAFGKSDETFKQLLDHPNPLVQAVVEARLGVKSTIKETRAKRFYKIGSRGKFPIYLNYYGAHTSRWSGGDKQNAQNLSRIDPNDPTVGALRLSLLAPPGHVMVVRDLSQIEARMLAYVAGQEDLLDLFRAGGDPYNRQGSLIFGYEIDRKKPEFWLEGLAGKASTLGNGYGMAWAKFQESLRVGFMGMPPTIFTEEQARKLGADVQMFCCQRSYRKGCTTLRDEAMALKPLNVDEYTHLWHCAAVKAIVDGYRSSNQAVVALWKEAQNALHYIVEGVEIPVGKRGLITTCKEGLRMPNGMIIRYHKLRCNDNGEYRYLANVKKNEWAYIYGGKCVENLTQALSRIVLSDQILWAEEFLRSFALRPGEVLKTVTSTHDEIVAIAPERLAEEVQAGLKRIMGTAPAWCVDLPLKSSGGYAWSYGECEK